ncbi:MAG: tripartite tricarboxylate transporter substrate binding protein [Xanthobacteraceae bacterium]|nr:tripartite tricarboxylate transporter substrate binding protein [Xanthobacteraceae bacterium]
MMSRIRLASCWAALCAAAIAFSPATLAQDYPTRPITLVVPYAAGGGNDVMARIVAEKMSKTLGQNVVIENRAGAGGSVATRQVARAAPDGYTLVLGGTGSLAVNPTLYNNVGYDPRKDFAPVGLIGTGQLIVVVNPNVAAKTIPELIALAKKDPGKLSYASAGVGSGIHLGAVLFELMAYIKLTHVPYRGTAPALTDLIGGHVHIYFSSIPSAIGIAKEGKVRALAVTGPKRSPVFPDLPTVAETLPGFEAVLHYGIVAPAGTPKPIIDKLNAALREAVAAPDTKERMAADGTEPLASTPDEYSADIDKEETKWSAIVKKSGAKAE